MKRLATAITWISLAATAAALLYSIRQLPLEPALAALQAWIAGLGAWAPAAFAGMYVVAVVLLVPASALTLAAGALFGLAQGMVVTSAASTTGAALAFLISRYVARRRVETALRSYPRFQAIDAAVSQGGWRVVALLRLSPAVPFNVQNYLYGLTGIRFWPCIATSWIAMLPGTLLYVYAGYVGRAGVVAAAGGSQQTTLGRAALALIGLLATLAVTVYITRLARRALAAQTGVGSTTDVRRDVEPPRAMARPNAATRRAILLLLLAIGSVVGAVWIHLRRDWLIDGLATLTGPPRVTLVEAYAGQTGGARFDHGLFDALLAAHVDVQGRLDYAALRQDAARLDAYLAALAEAPFDELGRDEKLALLLNAYNACTLRLVLDRTGADGEPLDSILSIPASQRWLAVRWRVGGRDWSLHQIEHEQIRPKFADPRIHFALVCASRGCPPLRSEAYDARRLDEQLESQARRVHGAAEWFDLSPDGRRLSLSLLYRWYAGDFQQAAGSVLDFAARYSDALRTQLEAGSPPEIDWLPYDWSLNSAPRR